MTYQHGSPKIRLQALVDKFRNNPEKLEELEAILRRQRAEFAAERAAELETVSSDVVKLREVIKEIRLRFQVIVDIQDHKLKS